MRRWLAVAAVLVLGVTGFGASAAAADDCAAPSRLYAVDANTGHLAEVIGCPDPAALTVGSEVDTGDWRGLRVFASRAGDVTVVYSLAPGGPLQARRQDAPGGPLGQPVQVGDGIDWSAYSSLISAGAGLLAGVDAHSAVRVFRHDGWDTGGTTVVEGPAPFPGGISLQLSEGDFRLSELRDGRPLRAVYAGLEGMFLTRPNGSAARFQNGRIPAAATVPVGELQYGLAGGTVVQLQQPAHPPVYPDTTTYTCPVNPTPWQVSAGLPGRWTQVVAPQTGGPAAGGWPVVQSVGGWYWPDDVHCPQVLTPYEWQ